MKEHESQESLDVIKKDSLSQDELKLSETVWYPKGIFPKDQIEFALNSQSSVVGHPVFGSGYEFKLGEQENLSQINLYPDKQIATVTNEDDLGDASTRNYLLHHLTVFPSQDRSRVDITSVRGERRTIVTLYADGAINERRVILDSRDSASNIEIDILSREISDTMGMKNRAITLPEAADFLGCGIDNIRYLIKAKKLKPVKLGGRSFISSTDLEDYLASGKRRRRKNKEL